MQLCTGFGQLCNAKTKCSGLCKADQMRRAFDQIVPIDQVCLTFVLMEKGSMSEWQRLNQG